MRERSVGSRPKLNSFARVGIVADVAPRKGVHFHIHHFPGVCGEREAATTSRGFPGVCGKRGAATTSRGPTQPPNGAATRGLRPQFCGEMWGVAEVCGNAAVGDSDACGVVLGNLTI
jgi:hypothetical protein